MLNQLNFNHLYYFYVIAAEGSMAKATKKLRVSQPTLSQQLKQFEDSMGESLFERSGRSLELNESGEYVFEYAKEIFSKSEEMLSGIIYRQKISLEAHYTIGITPSVSRAYASKLLAPLFMDETIGLKTIESGLDELIEKLYSQKIDFILSETPSEYLLGKGVEIFEIKKPKHYVVCGKNFEKKDFKFPEDADGVPYFKYTFKNSLQREVDRLFFKKEILPKVVGESDDLDIMLAATEQNHCFSIVPDIAVRRLINVGRLHKLGVFDSESSGISALFLEDISNDNVKKIVESIRGHFS